VGIWCKMFGHKDVIGSVGSMTVSFGAVVVNYRVCTRCNRKNYSYSTVHDFTLNIKESL